MNIFISMLRGINVSGRKNIQMEELRGLYKSLNLVDVETYVQSGNVVFNTTEQDTSKLACILEATLEEAFGYDVRVFIRATEDFQRIIESNPYLNERNEDPAKLYVTFLYSPPSESRLGNFSRPDEEIAEFVVGEREIYLFCLNGYGRTRLSNSFFEKKLDIPATTRNWNTVNALYSIAHAR
ncbi:MAG: DUF1697 domain-containing protein [Spirochaetota bacterium]|nr:MAG: DUF1697 domain-containing protein [Spirochaetota bacterium]